jgi:hypothetical protein
MKGNGQKKSNQTEGSTAQDNIPPFGTPDPRS